METSEVSPHPDRKDAALVAFKERYVAENFMNRAKDIPHLGKVELAWVAAAPSTSTFTPVSFGNGNGSAMDTQMDESSDVGRAEVDYDVADDDDRWLVE